MYLDKHCQDALKWAELLVPPGEKLNIPLMLAALCRTEIIRQIIPEITNHIPQFQQQSEPQTEPDFEPELREIFDKINKNRFFPVTVEELFIECINAPQGQQFLLNNGVEQSRIEKMLKVLLASKEQKEKEAREEIMGSIKSSLRMAKLGLQKSENPQAAKTLGFLEVLAKRININLDEQPLAASSDDEYFEGDFWGWLSPQHELHCAGNDFYKLNDFDAAIECYNMTLLLNPDLVETYFNRGLSHTRKGCYNIAIDDITKVIELNPNLAEAYYTRGLIYEYSERYEEALREYWKALEIDPKYDRASLQIERLEDRMKQLELKRTMQQKAERNQEGSKDTQSEIRRQENLAHARDVIRTLEVASVMSQHEEREWRSSEERKKVIEYLNQYGRLLSTPSRKIQQLFDVEDVIRSMVVVLSKLEQRNIILVGAAGTGKSALVEELAHRIATRHQSIPLRLQDFDIFEISSVFLFANSKWAGEYEEKVKAIIQIAEKCPNLILYIDEIHTFFQSYVESDIDVFNRGNQAFKKALSEGSINFIGCTTPLEHRHFIEPDPALSRRFTHIRIEPPTKERTVKILQHIYKPKFERHFAPLHIPDQIIGKTVELTDDYLPALCQPAKSIQILDGACAYAATETPPCTEVTEDMLWRSLECIIARTLTRAEKITEDDLFKHLSARLIGQDDVLRKISHATLAGLGRWKQHDGPRGVFIFAGPTGVGKTETALRLAEYLGGGKDALIRVDCNTLQGFGFNPSAITAQLLGAPRGSSRYVRGEGGLLSRIRDLPECIVLFDEFEKADPVAGKLLLQIIDTGRIEDADGNILDFRRAFIIFTTNAGSIYDVKSLGFVSQKSGSIEKPSIDEESLRNALIKLGLREEFLGRISHIFLFQGLSKKDVTTIVERQLNELRDMAQVRCFKLSWSPEIVSYLVNQWQPRFGVRHLYNILQHRIIEHLNLADALGELIGADQIKLEVASSEMITAEHEQCIGMTSRKKVNSSLVIVLH